jgi:hypothetical protein
VAGALLLAGCTVRIVPPDPPAPLADPTLIATSIFLIGDAGVAPPTADPVLAVLSDLVTRAPDSSLVVFLGDNLYPRGLPRPEAPDRWEGERRLSAQLDRALAGSARVIFVPGNHDWDKSGPDGLEAIRRQGAWIAANGAGRARLLPADGCPGPVVEESGGVRLVLLDTEWWLRDGPKGGAECRPGSADGVLAALAEAIDGAGGRPVIVAGHHPLATGGNHGGNFSLGDHLFPLRKLHRALWLPLPVIGSLYPVIRGAGVSDQDVAGGRNVRFRAALDSVFAEGPPTLYAAGHEHSLQLIDRGRPPLLAVSGSGILGHQSFLDEAPGARLALSEPGFMRVDLLRDGQVRLGVIVVDRAGRGRELHARWLIP